MSATNLDPIVNLAETGHIEAASQACDTALESEPNSPELLHLRGLLCTLSGRPGDAIPLFNRAIGFGPQPKYWSNLGNALSATGAPDQAEQAYRKAIELDPAFVDAWFNFGRLLQDGGRLGEAANALEHTTRLSPVDSQAWKILGDVYQKLDQVSLARQAYEQAYALTPQNLELAALIAYCLERENRLDDARQLLEITLAKLPEHPLGSIVMAILERRSGQFEAARARLLAMPESRLSLPLRVQREHEMGVLDDRTNEPESAFRHFARAKALQREDPIYGQVDGKRFLARLDRLIGLDYSWLSQCTRPFADGMTDPIFIVGFPRSGTTLLNHILYGHPDLDVMEELPVMSTLQDQLADEMPDYPASLATLPAAQARALRRQYFELVHVAHPQWDGKKRLVDKLPLNFTRLPLIVRLFPRAQILLALRHPYDACLSGFMQNFTHNDAMANFDDLRSAALMYDKIFTLWDKLRTSLPLPWLPVKYEDLVHDPEQQTRAITRFLGLPWSAALLRHADTVKERGHISTPSYQQVARPIHRESLGRWIGYSSYFESLQPLLRRHLKAWNYDSVPTR
jgi:tetratricopeptide (TPR) repeat protein